jgi:hypothetical protein
MVERPTARALRAIIGAGLTIAACLVGSVHWAALPEANAALIVRGGRCTGSLGGKALRGAVELEPLAEPQVERMLGNFTAPGTRIRFEAYLRDGKGTGRLWNTAGPQRVTNLTVDLRSDGFSLHPDGGTPTRFECRGW